LLVPSGNGGTQPRCTEQGCGSSSQEVAREGVIVKIRGHWWGAAREVVGKIIMRRWMRNRRSRFNMCTCAPNSHVHWICFLKK
jgi:hypothetical protein